MPRKRRLSAESEAWYVDAAKLMVLKGHSLRLAAETLLVGLTQDEAEQIYDKNAFQKILWTERFRFFGQIGENIERSRQAVVGRHEMLIQKLVEAQEWKKAADANLELARMEGMLQNDKAQVTILGLSQADMAEIRKELLEGGNSVGEAGTSTKKSGPVLQ